MQHSAKAKRGILLSQADTCTTFGPDFVVASDVILGPRTGRLPKCSRLVHVYFTTSSRVVHECVPISIHINTIWHDENTHSSRIVYALPALARRVRAIWTVSCEQTQRNGSPQSSDTLEKSSGVIGFKTIFQSTSIASSLSTHSQLSFCLSYSASVTLRQNITTILRCCILEPC